MIKRKKWVRYAKILSVKDIVKVVLKYMVMIVVIAYACIGIMMENIFYIAYNTTFTSCFCIASFLVFISVLIKYIGVYINKFYKNWRIKR